MKEKECFKCNRIKPLSEYYKHAQMGDGHLNKCKECTKLDALNHREKNIDKIREYDRERGNRLPNGYAKEYRERFPNKYKAHCMVSNAIRNKKLFKKPCELCGTDKNINAHHNDYLEPLNVRWLCSACHHQWHAKNGTAKNP